MSGDLFQSTAWGLTKKKGFPITKKERVVIDVFLEVDGVKFEFGDLLDTFENVEYGNYYTTFSDQQFKVLKENGIILNQGNGSWSATKGPNFQEFLDILYKVQF